MDISKFIWVRSKYFRMQNTVEIEQQMDIACAKLNFYPFFPDFVSFIMFCDLDYQVDALHSEGQTITF